MLLHFMHDFHSLGVRGEGLVERDCVVELLLSDAPGSPGKGLMTLLRWGRTVWGRTGVSPTGMSSMSLRSIDPATSTWRTKTKPSGTPWRANWASRYARCRS